MSSRKLSGAQRRKLLREEEEKSKELLKKVPKLDNYFKIAPKTSETNVIQPHMEDEEYDHNNVITSSSTSATGTWSENSDKNAIVTAINNVVTVGEECIQFKYFLKALKEENKEENYNMAKILQVLRRLKIAIYSIIDTALKNFLTIPTTNVTRERSFSTLRRVKNYLRNSLSDSKTSNLALLCIESELVDSLDEDDIISLFISSKLRKTL
ncbi:unnamed protein product [Psylliodes chrysocephalus]|uniref:HAT C-terminal dimerisation domain-containing protein n=1 Tax=Psylliodes chrysocephalus TaxID=3402493 RepID=A0A9P0CHB6_9CUCU|nr:unnamed protein product [Psylliodes chrysocephala]